MNLHIIYILKPDVVPDRQCQGIPCQMAEICGMAVQTSDSSTGPDGIICLHGINRTILPTNHDTVTAIILCYNIHHFCIFQNRNVWKLFHGGKEFACDFLSRNILMEQDSLVGVGALSGKGKCPVLILRKIHTVSNQIVNHIL